MVILDLNHNETEWHSFKISSGNVKETGSKIHMKNGYKMEFELAELMSSSINTSYQLEYTKY